MASESPRDSIKDHVQITDIIGNTGKYQLITVIVAVIATTAMGSVVVIMELLAPSVTMYWDWEASNPNRTIFHSAYCTAEDVQRRNSSSQLSNFSSRLIYESPYSNRPLTVEMNLICNRSWLISFANTVLLMGQVISGAITPLSERFGRRKCIIISSTCLALSSLCMTFSQGIVMFIIFFFFVGVASNLPTTLLYIQSVEIIPVAHIPFFGTFVKIGILIGQFIVVGAAWILKDWFYLQLFNTSFLALTAILSWYVLDSPMWLAVRGRYEDARENLIKILHRNGKDEHLETLKIEQWMREMKVRCEIQSRAEKGTFKDLFKNKVITSYTLASTFIISASTFISYGMVLNVESFGSGLFIDFTIANAFSILIMIVTSLCLLKVSVKYLILLSLMSAAVVCAIYPLLYGIPVARTVLSVLARVAISPAGIIFFAYVNEMYPTSVRSAMNGFVMLIAKAFTAGSSFTKEIGEHCGMYAPFILFGALSFACAIIMIFLPNSKGKPLIHTVDEMVSRRNENRKSTIFTITTQDKTTTNL